MKGRIILTATALLMTATTAVPAAAVDVDVVRYHREVPGAGEFTTCADGSIITFVSTSYRNYTEWYRDGVKVREHRHLTFDGTLTRGEVTVPYTGVWNRDQDLLSGEVRITGGQFRVLFPEGPVLVGAGVRAEGNEFVGTGDRFLRDLCTGMGALE
ncbi:hypothetical protein [Ornithinimicrobium cerasi]|uniref:hypothetical protein n=1 Tax=Ornithinimicrobium cerasi TaxID=2248773 RepID=UPI000EFFE4EE|nr:hypothetical protein [Ornithinimicrobium cerasi]